MNAALELLDVIAASHLPLAEGLSDQRQGIIDRLDERFRASSDRSDRMAAELAALLVAEGVVLSDEESVREVIAEYLHVIQDESAALDTEEQNFLDSFLK